MTRDAAAVRRNILRQEKLRRELAQAEADLRPHARRLMQAHGLYGSLPHPALLRLAEGQGA
jgi:hypothetical protein